ncbi:hypothetical protein [Wolbachia endosymbiont of Phyllotreta cruciferae]|uniref:hypothetical protein n=1 Tax=Wolbachia endosymbiont of Phyllotreta cruciferae TaxID=2886377 RepID=UPI00209F1989|nr:hypothetical protein [Wolbachia endosymbiont of Phyllotreta cruciferae]
MPVASNNVTCLPNSVQNNPDLRSSNTTAPPPGIPRLPVASNNTTCLTNPVQDSPDLRSSKKVVHREVSVVDPPMKSSPVAYLMDEIKKHGGVGSLKKVGYKELFGGKQLMGNKDEQQQDFSNESGAKLRSEENSFQRVERMREQKRELRTSEYHKNNPLSSRRLDLGYSDSEDDESPGLQNHQQNNKKSSAELLATSPVATPLPVLGNLEGPYTKSCSSHRTVRTTWC